MFPNLLFVLHTKVFISINVNGLWLRGRILQDLRKAAYGSLAFEGILMTKINRV